MDTEKTDAHRRLALQLAIQLPEKIADARRVLELAGDLLERFMVDTRLSDARRRAVELGWQLDAEIEAEIAEARRPVLAGERAIWRRLGSIGWGLSTLLVTVPLGMLAVYALGHGGVLCLTVGVMMVAAVLGRAEALALAAVSVLAQNLFLYPPYFVFERPVSLDLVGAAGYFGVAFALPWLIAHRDNIRARVIGEVVVIAPPARERGIRLVRSKA